MSMIETSPARHLMLLRHAKSDWHVDYAGDHERPLSKRGRRDAAAVGRFLAPPARQPDLVISSSAVRAHDTVHRAAREGGWSASIVVDPGLYASHPEAVLGRARQAPEDVGCLLLAGHEPVWSDLVSILAGGGQHRMPTATVACLRLHGTRWQDLGPGCATLLWLVPPKILR